jgi:hypothetical protein
MKIFLILLLVFICNNLLAQVKLPTSHLIEFKGIIQDSINNEIIPNANINLFEDNRLVKRAVSNNKGEFKVILPKGNYAYTVSCVGFKTKRGTTDSVLQNSSAIELKLSEATNTTTDVEIKIKKDNIGRLYCEQISNYTICPWKSYSNLIINPSNYLKGPFLVPPKEKK